MNVVDTVGGHVGVSVNLQQKEEEEERGRLKDDMSETLTREAAGPQIMTS